MLGIFASSLKAVLVPAFLPLHVHFFFVLPAGVVPVVLTPACLTIFSPFARAGTDRSSHSGFDKSNGSCNLSRGTGSLQVSQSASGGRPLDA